MVHLCDFSFFVGNDRKVNSALCHAIRLYIREPLFVPFDITNRDADKFRVTVFEFGLFVREGRDLRGTYWCKVAWVGKQDGPFIINVRVEVDLAV